MKNKIIITLLAVTTLLAMAWLTGCSEKIVNDNNNGPGLTLQPNFSVKDNLEAVTIYRVRVEAEDIPVPIEATLNMVNGLLVGEISVPAGRKRKITVEALDKDLNVIYRGVQILDIYPTSDTLPVIAIDLMPTVPIIRVTPHYTRKAMGIPFSCDVEVFSIPHMYDINFQLEHNSNIAMIDSIVRGSSLSMDDNFSTSVYWMDLGQVAYVTAGPPADSDMIVDGTGFAHLATFYFSSYSSTYEDIDYFDLVLQLNTIRTNEDGVVDTVTREGIFVDQGRGELPRRYWNLTYGSTGSDIGNDIIQTPDGNFAIVGYTNSFGAGNYDAYLLRVDSLGNFIGDKTYGGPGYDYATAVINTRDGGLAIVGYTDVGTVSANYNAMLIKTDLAGNVAWQKTYDTTMYDFGYDVKQTTDGGYIISGTSDSKIYLIKTDNLGNPVWSKSYEDTVSSHAWHDGYAVIQTPDGGYLVAGQLGFQNESRGGYLMKVNSQGNLVGDLIFVGTNSCTFNSIDKTKDGNYIICGEYDDDVYLVKVNSGGGVIWDNYFGGDNTEEGYSVTTCPDGGFFVAGYYYDNLYDKVGEMYLVKTDPSGNIVWDTTYGTYNTDYGYGGTTTSDGGFIACGYTYTYNRSNDIMVVKTDAHGRAYEPLPSK
jgi:hypothetical protein